MDPTENDFLKSLGFPTLKVEPTFNHFDFTKEGRRVLIIGPMGSGKTEAAAKIWRDASVARQKSDVVAKNETNGVDRASFIRSFIDKNVQKYPNTLAYRRKLHRL